MASRDLRQRACDRGRNFGVFVVDDARDLERRLAIQIGRGGVRLFGSERRRVSTFLRLETTRVAGSPANRESPAFSSASMTASWKRRPHLLDCLILAVGPGAVGQQGNRKLALGINPKRRSGVAEMPEGAQQKDTFPTAMARMACPTRGPRCAFGRGFSPREKVDGAPAEGWDARRSAWRERSAPSRPQSKTVPHDRRLRRARWRFRPALRPE